MDRESLIQEIAEETLLREAGQRKFLYNDVEELIENGFITHSVTVDGTEVIFRSLLPDDLKRLRARTANPKATGEISRWLLASSTWMVNGFELSLDPKDNAPFHLYKDLYKDMTDSLVLSLASVLTGLQLRCSRAVKLVEAYCYEHYSRSSWRMSPKGERGLTNSNVVKRLWTAYNLSEDESRREDMQWRYTQAIVASMTNKGGKEIGKSLDKAADKEKLRQKKVIEEAVNWVINGDKAAQADIKIVVNGKEYVVQKIQIAETFEELEADMKRTMVGEQDYHDHLVSEYQESIRQRTEEAREDRHQRMVEARQRADEYLENNEGVAAPLVGYTEAQLRAQRPELLEGKRTGSTGPSTSNSYVYERYFQNDIKIGVYDLDMKVRPADQNTLPIPEDARPEEAHEDTSFQDALEKRRPGLR